jgi:hypothetical protein
LGAGQTHLKAAVKAAVATRQFLPGTFLECA